MAEKPRAIIRSSVVRAPSISPSKAELSKLNEPDIVDTITAHISSGGTLVELSEAWNVRFAVLAHWMENHAQAMERFQQAIILRDEWMKEKLRQQLKRIISVDIREAFNQDGSLKPIKEMTREVADCLSSIEEGKIKFWNKQAAIHDMGLELGMFKERKEFTVGDSLEQLIAKSWQAPVDVTPSEPSPVIDAELLPEEKRVPSAGGEGETDESTRAQGGPNGSV